MDEWMRCMRDGDFAGAWQVSDRVTRARAGSRADHLPRHQQWIWDGSPIAGRRVLVRCYHGLGDTIQFVRFLPAIRALAARTVLWAQPALIPLLQRTAGIDELRPLHVGEPPAGWDVDVEIMELPHLLRITPATLAARVPYLHVEPAPRPPDARLHVGLVWTAGDWAPERSMRFSDVAPLAAVPGIAWHVLQRGEPLHEAQPGFGHIDADESVLGTARRMRALDLVLTVDSMPAHLAGALGVPVWTMLAADADWRWMRGRRTPWYPTMRLIRQRRAGEWAEVIARVSRALRRAVLR
jgi:hypothetical protein